MHNGLSAVQLKGNPRQAVVAVTLLPGETCERIAVMSDKRPQELLEQLSDEHDVLHKQIADLRQFWSEVNQLGQGPKYEEMGQRVRQLREVFAGHFASEERDGYLARAVDTAPRFSASAKRLESQHAQFLHTLDQLIARLAQCESAYHCWEEVRVEFEDFMQRLDKHEAAEMSLVRQAIAKRGGDAG